MEKYNRQIIFVLTIDYLQLLSILVLNVLYALSKANPYIGYKIFISNMKTQFVPEPPLKFHIQPKGRAVHKI